MNIPSHCLISYNCPSMSGVILHNCSAYFRTLAPSHLLASVKSHSGIEPNWAFPRQLRTCHPDCHQQQEISHSAKLHERLTRYFSCKTVWTRRMWRSVAFEDGLHPQKFSFLVDTCSSRPSIPRSLRGRKKFLISTHSPEARSVWRRLGYLSEIIDVFERNCRWRIQSWKMRVHSRRAARMHNCIFPVVCALVS